MTNVSNRHCYINDVSSYTDIAYIDDIIDLDTEGLWRIGASTSGAASGKLDGDIADLRIDFGTYIDLSVEANRRKFISSSGRPVDLGSDGSVPTGSAPDIFLSGDTATWHTNDGVGGGFTENGALTDGATVTPPNIIGWWKLDETSGSTIFDTSPNANNGTWTDGGDNDVKRCY